MEITRFILDSQSADAEVRTEAESSLKKFQEENTDVLDCIAVLLDALKDVPNVAEKVCGVIYNIVQRYEDVGARSSLLSPHLTEIIQHLLEAAERPDGAESRLRAAAYETLSEVIRCSDPLKASSIIGNLVPIIMKKLGQTMDLQIASTEDSEKQATLQASLCGVLRVIIQKLSTIDETKHIITQNADQIMALFVRVFGCYSSSVHKEAMLAIGALLAYATGAELVQHMPQLFKYLQMGIQNFREYRLCSITVGVIGEICRVLDAKVLPYCDKFDDIMTTLIENLQSDALHISVRPPIFSCFGNVALAIGANFEKHLPEALKIMQGDSQVCALLEISSKERMDYANQLRTSIFEAYSGILQGFKHAKAELMIPYAQDLMKFVERVSKDYLRDASVTKAAIAALGDLADVVGHDTKHLFNLSFCNKFVNVCTESEDKDLEVTAKRTQEMIGKLKIFVWDPIFCFDCYAHELWKYGPILSIWDLENISIKTFQVNSAILRIHSFLTTHGYCEDVFPEIRMIHASRGDLKEELVEKLESCHSISYFRDPGTKKQRADHKIREEIDEWCKRNPRGVVIIISSDKGYFDKVIELLCNGYKCIVVYNPKSTNVEYLDALTQIGVPYVPFKKFYSIKEEH